MIAVNKLHLSEGSVKILCMDKLVLIDGNSLLNRAFYATPIFSTRSGMPTNAVFGFVKLLFKIIDDVKPEYFVVAFDLKAPTFRHKMFEEYKANRKGMPDELAVQLEPLKNLLKAMKISTCAMEGVEADDIIGTLSAKYDVHSYIYTGDRDSFQLVDDKTDVYFTKRGVSELQKLNIDNFKTETGLIPSQIIDLKALMGDKSDNIPGVPGIGEKTAYELLARFNTLEEIYENVGYLRGATREKLMNNRELAELSYKLATIDRNCGAEINLAECKTPKKYNAEVRKIFTDLEFNSLLGLDIFDEEVKKSQADKNINPEKIVCTKYEEIASAIESNNKFGVVLNGSSAQIYTDKILYDVNSCDDFKKILDRVFSDKNKRVITYDSKSLMHDLKNLGVEFLCDYDDVSIAKYLCDFNASNLGFKELCEYYLYDFNYSAFAVCELFNKYVEIMKEDNVLNLYNEIEKPLVSVLFKMESDGVKVSSEMLDELAVRYENLSQEYKQKIYEECGCKFNLNSPAQLGDVLYNKLGLTEVLKKKTGKFSTSADILEKIRDKSPVVGYILKYRMYQKLYSTYLEGYKPLIDGEQIVHTTYNQTITTTGRLTSTNPNLQNIPIREDEGREIRKLFVPRDGNVFIDADYSQIELRLLAHFSDCKELIEAFKNGQDIHSLTASQVFGVPVNEVTARMRQSAKAVNFGIIYGLSEFGLSKNLDISFETAKQYIEKYFERYSEVKAYMNRNVELARENGFVSTLTGRKRVIPEIKSGNFNLRQFGERAAMNMPLQGSSADIIKIAMINVDKALKKNNMKTKLILQVHDELVLDAPVGEAEKASEILKYEMENAVQLKVPLTVEVHSGKNWYDAK